MAAQVEIEDQESVVTTNLDNGEIFDPLSTTNADPEPPRLVGNFSNQDSTILINEDTFEYDVIRNCFLSGMGPFANDTTIVTVRKNSTERITTKAKFAAFKVFTEAMAKKNNGDANVKYGWYSGSKQEIESIVTYGFSNREIVKFENNDGSHGVGIHLIHHRNSLAAAVTGEGDEEEEEGLKHILLCRLILGKPELIVAGSKQSYPSSNHFDSGVDNLQNPTKYVIWSSNMNSYILPTYIVSFRSPRLRGLSGSGRARSPCVSFSVLMSILSKSLDASRMNLILATYDDFRKRKLRREQLIRTMREVVGDHLLFKILKNQKL